MNVKELKETLQRFPDDMEVLVVGTDGPNVDEMEGVLYPLIKPKMKHIVKIGGLERPTYDLCSCNNEPHTVIYKILKRPCFRAVVLFGWDYVDEIISC